MKKIIVSSIAVLGLVLGSLGLAQVTNASVATISAGSNQTITLPTSSVTLSGSATASLGSSIASYSWSLTSEPSGVTPVIVTSTAASTVVNGLTVPGNYVFTLIASDNTTPVALTSSSSVTVTVNAAPVVMVSAGSNQTITLPTSSVNLSGSATATSPNAIASYAWTQVSGPINATITTPSSASTSVTGMTTAGTYVFSLMATDNASPSHSGSANISVYVNSVVTPPLPPVRLIKSKLTIAQNGMVNLQGPIQSISGNVLTVKVWGITFTVNTNGANFAGNITDLSMFKVGDYAQVMGQMDDSASTPTINARYVRDVSVQTSREKRYRKYEWSNDINGFHGEDQNGQGENDHGNGNGNGFGNNHDN